MKKELNDAIIHEEQGIKMYEEFALKFNEPVFTEILNVKKTGSEFLKSANLQNGKNNDFLKEISFENLNNINDKNDAIFKALSYEIESENLYNELASNEDNEALKDLYFRIWATSTNEYKKALQNLLNLETFKDDEQNFKEDKHINKDTNAFNYTKELSEALEKLKNGKMTANEALNLLQNPNISFIGGALIGALGGVLVNQLLDKNNNSHEK
ncbi:hypothetical protein HMPREF9309_00076 [Campylobacter ureolyticus ACS-301-V-Sch3b]|uniref:Uncharacterized protein n=1 Tax=Campylobacter ureolyticus ACS-301-V-Sch3b TaxID=883165 RepID=S3XLH4_9BACT|nr:hypothetical protein [Campylobacter ureolyticus]EPH10297.1 hypothetical protein HMPREF9309_00076 [Campylobacter ureolyticus ACS-301-V-Sch3b]